MPALVAVLLHKLANTTQYLGALNTLLAIDADAAAQSGSLRGLAGSMSGLSSTAVEVDEFGWTLGLLANACGANLLLERRERDGLRSFVRVVGECVRRDGRSLSMPEGAWPQLTSNRDGEDWRLPWAVGRWLFGVSRTRPEHAVVPFTFEVSGPRPRVVVGAPENDVVRRLTRELVAFDGRLEFAFDAESCALILPAGSLRAGSEPSSS